MFKPENKINYEKMQADIYLINYLSPGNIYPYEQLFTDCERYASAGMQVYVWSVPGFFMASAHPDLPVNGKIWSNGKRNFKTAKEAIKA